jgi:predicted nucleic acid-binding protein
MKKCIIADAGPVIALCKIQKLMLLNQLFEMCCITEEVYQEVISGNDTAVNCLQSAVENHYIKIETVDNISLDLKTLLDLGEASSITLALKQKQKQSALLIDEAKGRRIAKQHKLSVIGVAGLLILAKKHLLIDAVLPLLIDIRENGYWLSNNFLHEVAKLTNETFELL